MMKLPDNYFLNIIMPISFKFFLKSIYLHDDNIDDSFEEWLSSLSYKDLCDYWEDYLESSHAKIEHLFNLS